MITMSISEDIRDRLFELRDEKFAAFQANLTPSLRLDDFIGVRTPVLRKLAKEIAQRSDTGEFLTDLPHRYFDENQLHARGIKTAFVTLHVGLGTFRPVKEDNVLNHKMHSEHYFLPQETADLINETKKNGGRVIAVGTTACRTLESVATFFGDISAHEGYTDIFIYPGYEFKCIDGLITNFHLPESTLIMLVSAFMGYENTMNAYRIAVNERYRFFSFGDCMLIL